MKSLEQPENQNSKDQEINFLVEISTDSLEGFQKRLVDFIIEHCKNLDAEKSMEFLEKFSEKGDQWFEDRLVEIKTIDKQNFSENEKTKFINTIKFLIEKRDVFNKVRAELILALQSKFT